MAVRVSIVDQIALKVIPTILFSSVVVAVVTVWTKLKTMALKTHLLLKVVKQLAGHANVCGSC